jgi:putative ubiquitin-RnfH superfamily antitoxin RatB of RatAB toxin-antitoxin module
VNRLVCLAIRLYPAWWRSRYGPELQALVEDSGENWGTVLDLTKGALTMRLSSVLSPLDWPRTVVACGLLGACTGALVFVTTPARYASTSTIEIQAMDQVTPTPPAAVVLQAFNDTSLDRLVQKFGLYPRNQSRDADAIRRFRADISVNLTAPPAEARTKQVDEGQSSVLFRDQGALKISFSYPDGHKAQEVAVELVRLVIEENLRQPPQARYRVTGLPHQVPDGSNATTATGLGLGAGVLIGIGLATLRRRVQALSKSK